MSKMYLNLPHGRNEQKPSGGLTLGARDISDALRLISLLLQADGGSIDDAAASPGAGAAADVREVVNLEKVAEALLRDRRERARFFAPSMFGEAPWDMLLALYAGDRSEGRVTTTRLATLSGAPMTTALRWMDYLIHAGLVVKRDSSTDRRVSFIELTEQGRAAMEAYLRHVSTSGAQPVLGW